MRGMSGVKVELRRISGLVVSAAVEVHRALGPGLLESAYETCLAYELEHRELRVARQRPLPVRYKGLTIEQGYRLDLVVNDLVIVELKAVDELTKVHEAQMLSYLKFSGCPVGLLLNFNVRLMKDGIKRYAMYQNLAKPGAP